MAVTRRFYPPIILMKYFILIVIISITGLTHCYGQSSIKVPPYNDAYSKTVMRLESGDTTIDYKAFRESFIESKQFIIAWGKSTMIDSLKKVIYKLKDDERNQEILGLVQQILSINYTDMEAQKILWFTYESLGDVGNQKKYHAIQMELLKSIVRNGDGKTCGTGWPVISIDEEYYILDALDAKALKQQIDQSDEGICDKIKTTSGDGERTYYFDIRKIILGYKKLGLE